MRKHAVTGVIVALGVVLQLSAVARAQQPAPQPGLQVPQPGAQPTPQPAPQPGSQAANQAKLNELRSARELQAALEDTAGREVVPLQLQVVVARYQGDKRLSSMPFVLSINSGPSGNNPFGAPTTGSLRMGTKIAVPSTTTSEGKTTTTIQYRDVGTSIDAAATRRADGAFNVYLTVADSGVYPDDQKGVAATAGSPVIRSFESTNRLVLKDGQTTQFTAAADRMSGETLRVDVTLRTQK
jgi:hypothetical protein